MKELIRKILREETIRKIISIEYLGRKSLTEETKYDYIDADILDKINQTFDLQKRIAQSVSPLLAEYEYKGNVKKAYFNIKIDKHFAERNYRVETFPNDKYFVDPGIDEGINVIISNINKIWKIIDTRKYGHSDVLRLKTINNINYEILVNLTNPEKLDKLPMYDIKLYNQMKGSGKEFKREKIVMNVYNPIKK